MAFVFYDTETTGIHHHFDQILQFAAILTDDNLLEVERFEIRSRLMPHVVASPGAMNVTGVSAEQLSDRNYPSHFDMACQIHQKLLQWQPALFIGHNSINFDERLLRSAFYKSLLPIYLTNTNGNCRLDTLKMLQLTLLYEPDSMIFPIGTNGQPSFKLDKLAPANGFNHDNAHEAMSDVEATIFMCRKMRDNAPETWSRAMRFSNKNAVLDFCEADGVFGLSEFYFGRPYTFMLHQIGVNPDDGNEIVAFDLLTNPDDLKDRTESELVELLNRRPKPVRRFRTNALPGLIEADDAHALSNSKDLTLDELEDRANRLAQDSDLKARLLAAFMANKTQYDASPHVEENMYAAFPNDGDQSLMQMFHEADWSERYAIVAQFHDERYKVIGEQIIFQEAPENLTAERRQYWRKYTADRLLGNGISCDALTIPSAIQQAEDLMANLEGAKKELLSGHRDRLVEQHQDLLV